MPYLVFDGLTCIRLIGIFVLLTLVLFWGISMINVTRLNNKEFVINAELIESLEETPDTVITLSTGHKYLVKESVDEVLEKVYEYKRRIFSRFM